MNATKCNYCNKKFTKKETKIQHYNPLTLKDEYYHKSCRRIMMLLSGEALRHYMHLE